jgi:hypothetical protein
MDVDPLNPFMAFLIGPNGTGKSIALASWLDVGSVYFFDFDGRMASVSNWYKKRGLKRGQLTSDRYGPDNVYDAITKLKEFTVSCPHAAIAVDSFTAATISAVTFQLYRRMGKSGASTPAKTKGDLIVPDWEEWNGEAMYVTMILDLLKQIAEHGTAVFMTGHPVQRMQIKQVGGKQDISYQTKLAAFGHKSDSLVPIYFNEIYYFKVEYDLVDNSIHRVCYTQPSGDVAAKTALDLPTKLDWTNKNFYQLFKDSLGGSTNEVVTKPGKPAEGNVVTIK